MEWALGVLVDLLPHLEFLMSLPIALFLHLVEIIFSVVASLFAPFPFTLNISFLSKALVVVLHKICLFVANCSFL